MLFLNVDRTVEARKFSFGEITGITIGEAGRGRREVFLPTPPNLEPGLLKKGSYPGLTIGMSRNGRPRLNKAASSDKDIHLLLSSGYGYTRRGNGRVMLLRAGAEEPPTDNILAFGNGADGEAGRIGDWDAIVVKAQPGQVYRVRWSGYERGILDTIYIVSDVDVVALTSDEVPYYYDSMGEEVPFHLEHNKFSGHEWWRFHPDFGWRESIS